MTEKEMLQRTKNFALRVIKLVNSLPNNIAGRKIGDQLIRCGTSVAANFEQLVVGDPKQSLLQSLGLLKKKPMKVLFGWNLSWRLN